LLSEKALGLERIGMCSLALIFAEKDVFANNGDLNDHFRAQNVKDNVHKHKCGLMIIRQSKLHSIIFYFLVVVNTYIISYPSTTTL
jgi:hypothetical protein